MISESERTRTEASSLLRKTPKLAYLTPAHIDWLRETCTSDHYWALYFFCKIILGFWSINPPIHLLYTEFLDSDASRYKLAMMPRGFIKSWILYGKGIRDYLRDHNLRFLFAMNTEENVRKASDFISGQFTGNKLLRHLWPECCPTDRSEDRWTMKARTLPRDIVAPEPTYTFAGMRTDLTSGHYNRIYLDDVFSQEAYLSDEIANKVHAFVAAAMQLRDDPETTETIMVCTRWKLDDPAGKILGEQFDGSGRIVFRAEGNPRYICLKREAIENGEPIWPERLSVKELARLEKEFSDKQEAHVFASQYMNNPLDPKIIEFPAPRYWERAGKNEIALLQPQGKESILIKERDLLLYMTLDPAYTTKKTNDDSAMCVCGVHPAGYVVNRYSWVGKLPPNELAKKVVDEIESTSKRGFPLIGFGMEENAQQIAMKVIIQREADKRGVHIPWKKIKVQTELSKYYRIRNMVGLVGQGYYYTHASFLSANKEMRLFPASRKVNWLDAFAFQPQLWPRVRMEAVGPLPQETLPWRKSFDQSNPDGDLDLLPSFPGGGWESDGYGG